MMPVSYTHLDVYKRQQNIRHKRTVECDSGGGGGNVVVIRKVGVPFSFTALHV